uniref:Uncharacterized protein n=1 Tax=Arundo donax TaxID=35708 RepID=A0A0A9DSP2_ARUDO
MLVGYVMMLKQGASLVFTKYVQILTYPVARLPAQVSLTNIFNLRQGLRFFSYLFNS